MTMGCVVTPKLSLPAATRRAPIARQAPLVRAAPRVSNRGPRLLICAVLTRRLGIRLFEQDVFLNVVGGLRVDEPAADLAAAAAIMSSIKDQPVRADVVHIGEVGLSGELRWVSHMDARLREAVKLGFKAAVIPKRMRVRFNPPKNFEVIEARSLKNALQLSLLS